MMTYVNLGYHALRSLKKILLVNFQKYPFGVPCLPYCSQINYFCYLSFPPNSSVQRIFLPNPLGFAFRFSVKFPKHSH